MTSCGNNLFPPFWGECSGHGVCLNGTCICDPSWQGRHDFLNLEANRVSDCVTHTAARWWIYLSAYISCFLFIIYASIRLYSFVPLRLCRKSTLRKRETSIPHLYVFLGIIAAFLMLLCVTFPVFDFWNTFLRQNWIGNIFGTCIAATIFFIMTSLQGTIFVDLALKAVKTSDTKRLLQQMQLILASVALLCGLVWTIGHLGILFATSLEQSIQFIRAFTIALTISSFIWAVVNIIWSGRIINSLHRHLNSMTSVLQTDVAKKAADLDKLRTALVKLKQLRLGTTVPFLLLTGCGIVATIFPVLTQFWFITCTIAVVGALGSLFALRPQGWRF